MDAFLAVIDDLIQFAWRQFSGTASASAVVSQSPATQLTAVALRPAMPALPVSVASGYDLRAGESYFIGRPDVQIYLDPVITFDNTFGTVPYGQKVRLLELRGRWAAITFGEKHGWVNKDVLQARLVDVNPKLRVGSYYGPDDPETTKLRAYIADCFAGAVGLYPLNAAEYVTYRLQQHQRTINWGTTRFRIAGTWQRKLRGVAGIHIGVRPRTSAVMEYVTDDIGTLAFVDAVYADGSVKISAVGLGDEGFYTEQELSPATWKELRPVFISVE